LCCQLGNKISIIIDSFGIRFKHNSHTFDELTVCTSIILFWYFLSCQYWQVQVYSRDSYTFNHSERFECGKCRLFICFPIVACCKNLNIGIFSFQLNLLDFVIVQNPTGIWAYETKAPLRWIHELFRIHKIRDMCIICFYGISALFWMCHQTEIKACFVDDGDTTVIKFFPGNGIINIYFTERSLFYGDQWSFTIHSGFSRTRSLYCGVILYHILENVLKFCFQILITSVCPCGKVIFL